MYTFLVPIPTVTFFTVPGRIHLHVIKAKPIIDARCIQCKVGWYSPIFADPWRMDVLCLMARHGLDIVKGICVHLVRLRSSSSPRRMLSDEERRNSHLRFNGPQFTFWFTFSDGRHLHHHWKWPVKKRKPIRNTTIANRFGCYYTYADPLFSFNRKSFKDHTCGRSMRTPCSFVHVSMTRFRPIFIPSTYIFIERAFLRPPI